MQMETCTQKSMEPKILKSEDETFHEDTTSNKLKDEDKTYKWDIVWLNVIFLGTLHLVAVYGFYLKIISPRMSFTSVWLLKLLTILASIGITAGNHRLWTHKSYKANTALQCLLMFLATITYQNSIYIWARDHRVHHKCSETDGDPHNAKRGFFFAHVGWLLVKKHPEVIKQGKLIDMSDLKANKIVMFQHKYYFPLVFLCSVVIPGIVSRYQGWNWEETICYGIIYKLITSLNVTWCINSVAHLYGQKPYDKNIGPTESPRMCYLSGGEGFHNYHHTFPWDYKAAEFGNDTRNLTTYFIDFFEWLGWARDLRVATPEMIEKRCERTGGEGREFHMMDNKTNRTFHNIVSFITLISLFSLI